MQVENSLSALSCPSEPDSAESDSSGDIGEKKSQPQPSTLHNGRKNERSTSRVVHDDTIDSDGSTDAGPLIASNSRQMRFASKTTVTKTSKKRRIINADLSDVSSTSTSSSSESSPLQYNSERIKQRRNRQRKRKQIRPLSSMSISD